MAPQVGLEPTTLRLTGGEVGIEYASPRVATKRLRWHFFECARKVAVLSCAINATRKGSVSRAIPGASIAAPDRSFGLQIRDLALCHPRVYSSGQPTGNHLFRRSRLRNGVAFGWRVFYSFNL